MNNNMIIVGSDGRETPSLDYPPSYPYRCDCGAFVIEWDGETYDAGNTMTRHRCRPYLVGYDVAILSTDG